MNDQLNERLVSLMDYIGSVAKDADAFARAQLPDVAREIVAWELWSGLVYGLICIAIIAACIWMFSVALKFVDDHDDRAFPLFFVSAVYGVLSFVFVMVNTHSIVKATVAPRLVVLDYVKGAMR